MIYYKAKIVHVRNLFSVDAQINLGFSVQLNKTVALKGLSSLNLQPKTEDYDNAKHCLVVLLGGKDVILSVSNSEDPKITGELFLQVHKDSPVEDKIRIEGKPYLNVNTFMRKLSLNGYNVKDVTKVLNWKE